MERIFLVSGDLENKGKRTEREIHLLIYRLDSATHLQDIHLNAQANNIRSILSLGGCQTTMLPPRNKDSPFHLSRLIWNVHEYRCFGRVGFVESSSLAGRSASKEQSAITYLNNNLDDAKTDY